MSLLENQAFLQLKQGIFLLLRSIRIAGILIGDLQRNSARRSHHKKDDQTRRKGKEEEKKSRYSFPTLRIPSRMDIFPLKMSATNGLTIPKYISFVLQVATRFRSSQALSLNFEPLSSDCKLLGRLCAGLFVRMRIAE